MRIVLLLFCLCMVAWAHETDSLFVPKKPAKPVRFCKAAKQWIAYAKADSNLVEITYMKGLRMDLRYATFDNVTGHDLYCGIRRAFVHKDALPKLKRAIALLRFSRVRALRKTNVPHFPANSRLPEFPAKPASRMAPMRASSATMAYLSCSPSANETLNSAISASPIWVESAMRIPEISRFLPMNQRLLRIASMSIVPCIVL